MILPRDPTKLLYTVLDMVRMCTSTRGTRETFYNENMAYYMQGGTDISRGRANKVKPVVNRQASFLYAPESIKFWADVSPEEDSDENYKRSDPVSQVVSQAWTDSDLDTLFFEAVKHSRVNGCGIISVLPRPRTDGKIDLISYNINPKYFGVLREDVNRLERQQAVSLTNYYTIEEIEARISRHPDRNSIFKELATATMGGADSDVITMGPNATQFEAQYWKGGPSPYVPNTPVTYYGFYDLYCFDDDLGDWRVFTVTGNSIVWDRPISRIGIPGMLPFVKVCAEEHPEYFWGISLVDDLKKLQDWYSGKMDDMDNLIDQILNPPTAATGMGKSYEESLAAFRKPGGQITTTSTTAKIEQFVPTMPESVFEYIKGIDALLMDQSNMRPSMFGRQEAGVRTEGMAAGLLRVAGAEMRVMGLAIEKQAQQCAQMLFRYLRRYSPEKVVDEDGKLFSLVEFPDDARIRVDGHSSNPLFVEDNAQLAMGLMRYGAITQETLVRMLHPALEGKILHDLRKIQWVKVQEQTRMQLEQQAKRSGKGKASGSE